MTVFWIIVAVLIVIGMTSGFVMFSRNAQAPYASPTQLPKVSIVIPARNEAGRISPLLASIREQTYPQIEVIVVDDGSTDDTMQVAASFGATAVKAQLLDGLTAGKANACAYGATIASGDYFLFLDADVQFTHPTSVAQLVSYYEAQQHRGILSVQPYHQTKKLYESLSVIFNIITITGMNVFSIWRHRFQTAGSFGPCILCDRLSYEATGGHRAAEHSIMEDFALSDRFMADDYPVTNYLGKGLLTMRMYEEGPKQLVEGWTKNLATASQSTHPFIMTLVQMWIFGSLVAFGALVGAWIIGTPLVIGSMLIFYLLYGISVYTLSTRIGHFHWSVIPLHTLYVAFFVAIFMYSLYRTHIRHSVMWRGRKMKV